MNKVKKGSNMYQWVTHTWSPIEGCMHQCEYCYVRRYKLLPSTPMMNAKRLQQDLGRGNKIFVGHMCDMWAKNVPNEFIIAVLDRCRIFKNTYIFQTKNPTRFIDYKVFLPGSAVGQSILGTTIETDNWDLLKNITKAPPIIERFSAMKVMKKFGFTTFITIEPILKFDLNSMIEIIQKSKVNFVNIGADSKGHNLIEPTYDEVMQLVKEIRQITEINIKSNLQRLRRKK